MAQLQLQQYVEGAAGAINGRIFSGNSADAAPFACLAVTQGISTCATALKSAHREHQSVSALLRFRCICGGGGASAGTPLAKS